MVAFRGPSLRPPSLLPHGGEMPGEEVYQTRVVVGPVVPVRFSPVVLKPALNTRIISFNAGVPMPERPLHVKSWQQNPCLNAHISICTRHCNPGWKMLTSKLAGQQVNVSSL